MGEFARRWRVDGRVEAFDDQPDGEHHLLQSERELQATTPNAAFAQSRPATSASPKVWNCEPAGLPAFAKSWPTDKRVRETTTLPSRCAPNVMVGCSPAD